VWRAKKAQGPLQEISAYELQRERNIVANNEMLASLNLSPLVKKTKTATADRKRLAAEKKLIKLAQLDDAKDLATCITKGSVRVPVRCCSMLTSLPL